MVHLKSQGLSSIISKGENRSEKKDPKHLWSKKHREPKFEPVGRKGISNSTDPFDQLLGLKQGYSHVGPGNSQHLQSTYYVPSVSNHWTNIDSFDSHHSAMKYVLSLSQFCRYMNGGTEAN